MLQPPETNQFYVPALHKPAERRPRISGTAVVGGVHLSTGSYGTIMPFRLFVSGAMIALLLGLGMVLTFVEAWLLDRVLGTGMAWELLGLAPHVGNRWTALGQFLLAVLPLLNFLVMLRLSPLSGYHAAEHKVVAAIEAHGDLTWSEVVAMPRAHPRCGTVLLFGVLPALLIAFPLWHTNPLLAVTVAVVGWILRYHVGYFIQQNFTTKPPTPEQLQAGMEAGRKLLYYWRRDPGRTVPPALNLWTRGMPQLVCGVLLGQQILLFVQQHVHLWLDW